MALKPKTQKTETKVENEKAEQLTLVPKEKKEDKKKTTKKAKEEKQADKKETEQPKTDKKEEKAVKEDKPKKETKKKNNWSDRAIVVKGKYNSLAKVSEFLAEFDYDDCDFKLLVSTIGKEEDEPIYDNVMVLNDIKQGKLEIFNDIPVTKDMLLKLKEDKDVTILGLDF